MLGEAAALREKLMAVLDTGITPHPELAGRMLPGYDFVSDVEYANDGNGWDADAPDPGAWVSLADRQRNLQAYAGCNVEDSSWHRTIVAGMVAAQVDNGTGGAGIQRGAAVLPVRVAGKCGAEVLEVVHAFASGQLQRGGRRCRPQARRLQDELLQLRRQTRRQRHCRGGWR
jgi:serine protease